MLRPSLFIALIALLAAPTFAQDAPLAAPDAQNSIKNAQTVQINAQQSPISAPSEFLNNLQAAMVAYFNAQHWAYTWHSDTQSFTLRFDFDGIGAVHTICALHTDPNDAQIVQISTTALGTFNVPVAKRAEIAQFLIGKNFNNIVQGFQMDLNDGQFVYGDTLACYNGQIPPPAVIDRFFSVPIHELKAAHSSLMKILYANVDANEALNAILP